MANLQSSIINGKLSVNGAITLNGNSILTLAGGTLTGSLNLKAEQYYETNSVYGIVVHSSDIIGLNALYFADLADGTGEGLNFYRSSTTWDTFYAKNGVLYFVPNRSKGSSGTAYTVSLNSHKHSVTATGTIGNTTAGGTVGNTTAGGSVSSSFSGTAAKHSHSFSGTAGTTGDGSGSTASIYSITGVGSVPSLTGSVTNQCLTLTFTAGSTPTRSSAYSVSLSGHTHSFTPSGTVGDTEITPAGSVSSSFTGTAHSHSFTGTAHNHSFSGTAVDSGAAK